MAYYLYQFDDLVLPAYDAVSDIGTGKFHSVFLPLGGGGVYDVQGTEQSKRRATPLSKAATMIADTAADLRTAYNLLRAKAGRRARLWRRWDSGEVEWCWARMEEIPAQHGSGDGLTIPLELNFVMISPHWYGTYHGAAWLLDAGVLLGLGWSLDDAGAELPIVAGVQYFLLANGGNRRVSHVVIRVQAGTADITNLLIGFPAFGPAWQNALHYQGTIAAGDELVIDCGGWSVLNNGVDDWANLDWLTSRQIDDLFRLEPGDTNVYVLVAGGGAGSTIMFERFDGYE